MPINIIGSNAKSSNSLTGKVTNSANAGKMIFIPNGKLLNNESAVITGNRINMLINIGRFLNNWSAFRITKVTTWANNGNPRNNNGALTKMLLNNLSPKTGNVIKPLNNTNGISDSKFKTVLIVANVTRPAKVLLSNPGKTSLRVFNKNGNERSCDSNNNGNATNLTPGIRSPTNEPRFNRPRPSKPRRSTGTPPNIEDKSEANTAGTRLVILFKIKFPIKALSLNRTVPRIEINGMLIQFNGLRNCSGPNTGNSNKPNPAPTNNPGSPLTIKSFKNLNGNLIMLNNESKLISNGIKNNRRRLKLRNGINDGNNAKPFRSNLPIVFTISLINLFKLIIPNTGNINAPTINGSKYALNADIPFANKNGTAPVMKLSGINKPNRFSNTRGAVNSPLIIGRNTIPNPTFSRLIIGNNNNELRIANGRPSRRILAISPIVLIIVNGIATNLLNNLIGNKTGANNSPNPGVNNATKLPICPNGSSKPFNRSTGKLPNKSLAIFTSCNGFRSNPNPHSNGVNKFRPGINGSNKLNRFKPTDLSKSNGSLTRCLISLLMMIGVNKPPNNDNGSATSKPLNKINGKANSPNNNLSGNNGKLAKMIGSNNVNPSAASAEINNNPALAMNLTIFTNPLTNTIGNNAAMRILLRTLSAGNPNHNGNVITASTCLTRLFNTLKNVVIKCNGIRTTSTPANAGSNNNNGAVNNPLINGVINGAPTKPTKFVIGNNSNEFINAIGMNNAPLIKSLNTLINEIGVPTSPGPGMNKPLSKSIGNLNNGPSKSFRTSANLNP